MRVAPLAIAVAGARGNAGIIIGERVVAGKNSVDRYNQIDAL